MAKGENTGAREVNYFNSQMESIQYIMVKRQESAGHGGWNSLQLVRETLHPAVPRFFR